MMTVDEVAALFRVHRVTIYRWKRAGKTPPCVKIGRRVLFRRDIVDQWYDKAVLDPSSTRPLG